jgi:hypothetical protein
MRLHCVRTVYRTIQKPAAGRDLLGLLHVGVIEQSGKGRTTRYVLKSKRGQSTDNLPTKNPNLPISKANLVA